MFMKSGKTKSAKAAVMTPEFRSRVTRDRKKYSRKGKKKLDKRLFS
jgi:stalled ribosome alternative rescue factor ArfA